MPRVLEPKTIRGPMPNGDAEDPPVSMIALCAAREIDATLKTDMPRPRTARISRYQLRIEAAIQEALDRCQALGGRRTRY